MNDAMAISSFNQRVKTNKKEVIDVILKQAEQSKLDLIKMALDEKNIKYDNSINDYNKFINSMQGLLNSNELAIFNDIVKRTNQEVDKMVEELRQGSTTAFTNFVNNAYKNIVAPIGNSLTNSLAANALLTLTPTAIGKAGVGIALTGVSLYNIHKLDKYKRVTNKAYELNKILEELEVTLDDKGNIIDTRFNDAIQNSIKGFLDSNNINYEYTGYLSLRDAIYNLEDDKKEQLCNLINNLKGNVINLDDRLKDFNEGIFKKLGNNVKNIGISASAGIGAATAVNAIEPGIIGGPVNGFLGGILGRIGGDKVTNWIRNIASNSKIAKGIVNVLGGEKAIDLVGKLITGLGGLGAGVASFLGRFIPILGNAIAIENLILFGIGGAGVGLLSVLGKNIYRAIKNRKNTFATQENMKKLQELDAKLYGNSDIEELNIIKAKVEKQNSNYEAFIINITCQYMDEMNIEYGRRPNTLNELYEIINKLDKKEKKQIYDLANSLDEYFHREPNEFKNKMQKVGKCVKTALSIGLAGISVADILTAGGFINSIKAKLPKKLYPEANIIPEYKENIEVKNSSVQENAQTPTPTPSSTKEIKPTPGPALDAKTVQTTTKILSLDNIVSNPNNKELIAEFSNLTDKELYEVFSKARDTRQAVRGLELLSSEDFLRLKRYAETSADIERKNFFGFENFGYARLKEGFNNIIKSRNAQLSKAVNQSNIAEAIAKGVTIPTVAYNSFEEEKSESRRR